MTRLGIFGVFFGIALGCDGTTPRQPTTVQKQAGGGIAMSRELATFLTAQDLDDVSDTREKIQVISPEDATAIRSVLEQWQNPQAVSNLLFHPDLIPEDIRLATLHRGLAERKEVYYVLAAIVGFGDIDGTKLSAQDRGRVLRGLLAVVRATADVRAQRASVSFRNFVSDGDAPQVVALLEHTDDTVRKNLKAWLFDTFKDRGAGPFTDAVRQSGLAKPAQQRVVSEFNDFLVSKRPVAPLFAYIPNRQDFKPSEAQGIVPDGR